MGFKSSPSDVNMQWNISAIETVLALPYFLIFKDVGHIPKKLNLRLSPWLLGVSFPLASTCPLLSSSLIYMNHGLRVSAALKIHNSQTCTVSPSGKVVLKEGETQRQQRYRTHSCLISQLLGWGGDGSMDKTLCLTRNISGDPSVSWPQMLFL